MAKALEHRRLDVGLDHQLHALRQLRKHCRSIVERLTAALPARPRAGGAGSGRLGRSPRRDDPDPGMGRQSGDAGTVRVPARAKCADSSAPGEQAECLRPGRRRFRSDAGDGEPGGGHRARRRVPADRRDKCVGCKSIWSGDPSWRTRPSAGSSPTCATRPGHGALSDDAGDGRRSFAKARSVAMKRAIIGAISFAGSGAP